MKTPQVHPRLRRGRRDDAEINSCNGLVWERGSSGAWAKVDVGLLRDDVLSRHAARCRCAGASVERSGGAPADAGLVSCQRILPSVDVGLVRDDVLSRHDAARYRCAGVSVERSGGAPG